MQILKKQAQELGQCRRMSTVRMLSKNACQSMHVIGIFLVHKRKLLPVVAGGRLHSQLCRISPLSITYVMYSISRQSTDIVEVLQSGPNWWTDWQIDWLIMSWCLCSRCKQNCFSLTSLLSARGWQYVCWGIYWTWIQITSHWHGPAS